VRKRERRAFRTLLAEVVDELKSGWECTCDRERPTEVCPRCEASWARVELAKKLEAK
jgi:hypothetical protein